MERLEALGQCKPREDHFTSVVIRIRVRIRNPDRHQSLIVRSLAHWHPSLKVLCKSVRKLLRKAANSQASKHTSRQTATTITYPPWSRQ